MIVSFATRPGRGSEGGVGWAFAVQAARWAVRNSELLYLVIDDRDTVNVRTALAALGQAVDSVTLVSIALPSRVLQRYGDQRTRKTYLIWRHYARKEIRRRVAVGDIDLVHQITFATATLPHSLPSKNSRAKTVWGPVMVPSAAVAARGKSPSMLETLGVHLARILGRLHARNIDLVLAQNEFTARWLSSQRVILEPNMFIDIDDDLAPPTANDLLVMSGLLIDRKRPWLAIQAMLDPRLAAYRLQILGDGPLRSELETFTARNGLSARVEFCGQLDRSDALVAVAAARVLVHPAAREGACWAIGEAATLGVPAVAFKSSGSGSTIALSENGGEAVEGEGAHALDALVEGILAVLARPKPKRSTRWSADRVDALLDAWWATDPKKS